MPDPNYLDYLEEKHAREATATAPDLGTDDGAGWFFRELSDGTVEWRAPAGYRWAIDPHDRWATGGPQFTSAADRRGPRVPKLEHIASASVRRYS